MIDAQWDVPYILILTRNCASYVLGSRDHSTDTGKLVISEVAVGFYISEAIGLMRIACYITYDTAIPANVKPW